MPLYATTAQNSMLDAMWSSVASFEVGLLTSDPRQTGTVDEVTGGGYARVAGTSADWSAASSGSKEMATKMFPTSTAAWSGTAVRWGIFVGGVLWDHGLLADPIAVTAAGEAPAIRIRVGFNEGLI